MSLLLLGCFLALAVVSGLTFLYFSKLNALRGSGGDTPAGFVEKVRADRYRPMLRLLSDEDLMPVRENTKLVRKMRAERTAIFRGYLRCLARDYGNLLAGLRITAAQSEVDRPDLALAILRNRMLFAGALFRLDLLSVMYRFGVHGVDVSGLIASLDALRVQTAQANFVTGSFAATA